MPLAAATSIPKKIANKDLIFPADIPAKATTTKDNLRHKSDVLSHPKKCPMGPDELHNIALTDSQRVVLELARSRAEAEAVSLQNNLFQAGFQDCASEVIRFLTTQENLDNGNPLVQGLQSHLNKMSNTICGESFANLDVIPSSQTMSTDSSLSSPNVSFNTTKNPSVGYHSSHSQITPESQGFLQSMHPSSNSISSSTSPCQESLSLKRKRSVHISETHRLAAQHTPPKLHRQRSCPTQETGSMEELSKCLSSRLSYPLGQPCSSLSSPLISSSSLITQPTPSHVGLALSSSSSSQPSTTPSFSSSSSLLQVPSVSPSILELNAHFLQGIDTNSLASGNFADILLAVESCQSHDNFRVRMLADTIINLIHNNVDDDDEYDDIDDTEGEEESKQVKKVGREKAGNNSENAGNNSDNEAVGSHTEDLDTRDSSTAHEDSGIDLGEDWCNPADIIEC